MALYYYTVALKVKLFLITLLNRSDIYLSYINLNNIITHTFLKYDVLQLYFIYLHILFLFTLLIKQRMGCQVSIAEVDDQIQLTQLKQCTGLNPVIFIDFSKSNQRTAQQCYSQTASLHDTLTRVSPYQNALVSILAILDCYNDELLYPVYKFGDVDSKDIKVLPILSLQPPDEHYLGSAKVIEAYVKAAQSTQLSGPTSFKPIIEQIAIIKKAHDEKSKKFHLISLIFTDADLEESDFQLFEQQPTSFIFIAFGDGPFNNFKLLEKKYANSKNSTNLLFIDYFKQQTQYCGNIINFIINQNKKIIK